MANTVLITLLTLTNIPLHVNLIQYNFDHVRQGAHHHLIICKIPRFDLGTKIKTIQIKTIHIKTTSELTKGSDKGQLIIWCINWILGTCIQNNCNYYCSVLQNKNKVGRCILGKGGSSRIGV